MTIKSVTSFLLLLRHPRLIPRTLPPLFHAVFLSQPVFLLESLLEISLRIPGGLSNWTCTPIAHVGLLQGDWMKSLCTSLGPSNRSWESFAPVDSHWHTHNHQHLLLVMSMVGSVWTERAGQGKVGGCNWRVQTAWLCPGSSLEMTWLALGVVFSVIAF